MVSQSFLKDLSYQVIGCIFEVHNNLGPGLLESVYQTCLMEELRRHNLRCEEKPYVPIIYKQNFLGGKFQMDILVESELVIELKSVENMIPLYKAQLITYLKLAEKHKGLLVNFNSVVIKDQIINIVIPSFFTLPQD